MLLEVLVKSHQKLLQPLLVFHLVQALLVLVTSAIAHKCVKRELKLIIDSIVSKDLIVELLDHSAAVLVVPHE